MVKIFLNFSIQMILKVITAEPLYSNISVFQTPECSSEQFGRLTLMKSKEYNGKKLQPIKLHYKYVSLLYFQIS